MGLKYFLVNFICYGLIEMFLQVYILSVWFLDCVQDDFVVVVGGGVWLVGLEQQGQVWFVLVDCVI